MRDKRDDDILVVNLRGASWQATHKPFMAHLCHNAAERIEELETEAAIVREVVEQIADMARAHLVEHHNDPMCRRSAEYVVERADFLLGVTT